MTEENKSEESIFDGAEVTEEMPEKIEEVPTMDEDEAPEEWAPTVSKESEKAKLERKGKKEKVADGTILTIKGKPTFTRPKNKDKDGNLIEPKLTQKSSKPYYGGKLVVRFEEDNLIEYYPNVKYYVNDGVISRNVKLPREGKSVIALIVQKVVKHIGRPSDEVSDDEILTWMAGKKIKTKLESGDFNGPWFRNDILEFVLEE